MGRAGLAAWLVVVTVLGTAPARSEAAPLRGRTGGYKDQSSAQVQTRQPRGEARSHQKPSHKLTARYSKKPASNSAASKAIAFKRNSNVIKYVRVASAVTRDARATTPAYAIRQFARGIFVEGPKHMWHSMVKRPAIFFGGLIGVGLVGAAGAHFDVNVEPVLIGAGVAALGAQIWQGIKAVRKAPHSERARLVGEQLIFPTLVWAGSTAAALSMGHGPHKVGVGKAAAKAMLFGGEAPANLSMAVASAQKDTDQTGH